MRGVVRMNNCPKCGRQMEYHTQFNQWYCRNCGQYLYQLQQGYGPQNSVTKRSIVRIIMFISLAFCLITVILFGAGLLQIHIGLGVLLKTADYNVDISSTFAKGIINIMISLALFMSIHVFMDYTLRKKEWWEKLSKSLDLDTESYLGNLTLKRNVTDIFQMFYGTIILIGIIMFAFGIIFLNIVQNVNFNIISSIFIFIGIFINFLGYRLYKSEMENFSRLIFPLFLKQDKDNILPKSE